MVVEDEWKEVVSKLRKAQKVWDQLSRILRKEGADRRMPGKLYVVVM